MDFSHHAYGVFGEDAKGRISEILADFSKAKSIDAALFSESNPDFLERKFETMTIEDSRSLREIHESMPFSADIPRIFVIEIHGATREAQNALLKVLEEPRPDNYFFIAAPSADIFLPTVRSRLHIFAVSDAPNKSASRKPAEQFLKMPLAEKIAFADELAARISDEKSVKHDAVEFFNALERTLYDGTSGNTVSRGSSRKKFESIARARDYLNDRAPSVKMLLEYVALSV